LQDPLLRFRKTPSGIRRRGLVRAQQEKHESTGDRAEESHQNSTEYCIFFFVQRNVLP